MIFAITAIPLVFAVHAQAAVDNFVPLAKAPDSSKLGGLYKSTSLAGLLSGLFTAALSVGGILAVLRLTYAGYLYMTSEAWGVKSHAKEVIGDAILGLLLLLAVVLILKQINPNILKLDILTNFSTLQANQEYNPGTGGKAGY